MSRRRRAQKRKLTPDAIYNSELITRFTNRVMQRGKKNTARRIVYGAFNLIQEDGTDPMEIFGQAMRNATPLLQVRPRRVGGATYQVPVEVREDRGAALAMRWIIDAARARGGSPMVSKLAAELTDAARGQGNAVRRREELHRMADANKAFAHYRW
ncbi:MAG: 30S ribosomal protein S7 [Chloroflexota bacterium]|jgi:small subunit ribosomal protein S7|nr:30S ribosomal protein S7 [Chloroflexota bacterium]|tara:strand:- start:22246 stop:22713 length:468 start_codon:yes stop_codon:yes gene_type:complete